MKDPDEFTPRELGMKLGHTWAEMAPMRGSETEVATVADGGAVPDNVRQLALSGMPERLNGRDDERAFMEGFVHGVRAFVASVKTGATRN
jgi:hypothetical protein